MDVKSTSNKLLPQFLDVNTEHSGCSNGIRAGNPTDMHLLSKNEIPSANTNHHSSEVSNPRWHCNVMLNFFLAASSTFASFSSRTASKILAQILQMIQYVSHFFKLSILIPNKLLYKRPSLSNLLICTLFTCTILAYSDGIELKNISRKGDGFYSFQLDEKSFTMVEFNQWVCDDGLNGCKLFLTSNGSLYEINETELPNKTGNSSASPKSSRNFLFWRSNLTYDPANESNNDNSFNGAIMKILPTSKETIFNSTEMRSLRNDSLFSGLKRIGLVMVQEGYNDEITKDKFYMWVQFRLYPIELPVEQEARDGTISDLEKQVERYQVKISSLNSSNGQLIAENELKQMQIEELEIDNETCASKLTKSNGLAIKLQGNLTNSLGEIQDLKRRLSELNNSDKPDLPEQQEFGKSQDDDDQSLIIIVSAVLSAIIVVVIVALIVTCAGCSCANRDEIAPAKKDPTLGSEGGIQNPYIHDLDIDEFNV